MTALGWTTADLIDAHPEHLQAVHLPFADFGGRAAFCGPMATVSSREDWRPVLRELSEPGDGRVLVVDGAGALVRAVLGERLLNTAARNGWSGVVVHGAVRDSAQTRQVPIGLRALGTIPQRGESGVVAIRQQPMTFGGVTFVPGEWLWADQDGMVVGMLPDVP